MSEGRLEKQTDTLWRNRDFVKLWLAQTISRLGSGITSQALPLAALLALSASPLEMGLLGAVEAAPVLLVGLLAGVWVDRLRRRPILIAADLGRALLLLSIPLAALLGWLGIWQLYVVAFLVGILTVFFEVADRSFLPTLIGRERIVEGNSKLQAGDSVAGIAGPSLGGTLVQLITAPIAILLDALSFVLSALFIGAIRTHEPPSTPHAERRSMWRDIGEGLRVVLRNPLLRATVGSSATIYFFGGFFSLYGLFVIRDLQLSPAVLGVLISAGSVSALVGAALVGPVTRRFGVGRAMIGALLIATVPGLLIPLAGGPPLLAALIMLTAQLTDAAWVPYFVNEVSLRQSLVPDRLLGRANASVQFIVGGVAPLGAIVGGVLGEAIGPRLALLAGIIGVMCSVLWLIFSPLRTLRELPSVRQEL